MASYLTSSSTSFPRYCILPVTFFSSSLVPNVFLLLFQVSDQVLTAQVQNIIDELVNNFMEVAGTFALTRLGPLKHLNGDLKALLLVSTARSDHMSQKLLAALQILRIRVQKSLEVMRNSFYLEN